LVDTYSILRETTAHPGQNGNIDMIFTTLSLAIFSALAIPVFVFYFIVIGSES